MSELYGKSDYIFGKFSIGISVKIMGVSRTIMAKIELKFIVIFASINCRIWLS